MEQNWICTNRENCGRVYHHTAFREPLPTESREKPVCLVCGSPLEREKVKVE